jgi:UDP-galactopyranose mutase
MLNQFDYHIIGSGLTGSTIARLLSDEGKKVLVIEKRSHVGGNVFDHVHESGIRVHTYGPHYFRTSSQTIWNYVNRFDDFYEYVASIKSYVDGRYENWPIAVSYIRENIGDNWAPSYKGEPKNFEEAALSLMPEKIYYKFIRGYNIKQWGVDPKTLSVDLIKRFDVRMDDDPRLMPHHKHQGIPKKGYANFMKEMLKGIPVMLNVDYLNNRNIFNPSKKIIYTGPIDAFFNFQFGKLKYRGQNRVHEYLPEIDFKYPYGQINNPQMENGEHIRTLEWKHFMEPQFAREIKGTVLTKEITITPTNYNDFEYPFPDIENKLIFSKYQELANQDDNLIICGRLGEYRYYDMDQAIGRAFKITKDLLSEG